MIDPEMIVCCSPQGLEMLGNLMNEAIAQINAKEGVNLGFSLFVFNGTDPEDDEPSVPDGKANYISNCEFEDVVKMLEQFIFKMKKAPDVRKH